MLVTHADVSHHADFCCTLCRAALDYLHVTIYHGHFPVHKQNIIVMLWLRSAVFCHTALLLLSADIYRQATFDVSIASTHANRAGAMHPEAVDVTHCSHKLDRV